MNELLITDAMKKHGNSVLRTAASITGNLQDAEDVFSDVFFTLWKCEKTFVSDGHMKLWLIRVTVNKAINNKKQAYNRYRASLCENLPAQEKEALSHDVPKALMTLTQSERVILYLHYYEGYKYIEIAKMLRTKESSVRSKALRARNQLKDFLSNQN